MKKLLILTGVVVFFLTAAGMSFAAEKAPQKVIDLANSTLAKLGSDPVIVSAVKAENSKGKTLAQIQELDKKWKGYAGIADYMQAIMDSECGKHLQQIQNSKQYFVEIFLVDNQGANVALSEKTSDYWQGDEDKFSECYNGGRGKVYVSDVKFDDSAQTYLVQVSVPVKDNDKTIGVLVIGIDIDNL